MLKYQLTLSPVYVCHKVDITFTASRQHVNILTTVVICDFASDSVKLFNNISTFII